MKNAVTALAKELKISAVGFCAADEYDKNATNLKTASFAKNGAKNTQDVLPGAKTVVVCAFNYRADDEKGNVARYARGLDYHTVAADKLKEIARLLADGGFGARYFSDTGDLNERLLAKLSGIAFIGRNHMAINPVFGSYFVIGYVVTDCVMEPDAPCELTCAECGRCAAACPGGALDGDFCEEKCLSYISQKKGELTEYEESLLIKAGSVWGCDLCQEVCPHNNNSAVTDIEEFGKDLIADLYVDENMSNREFKRAYGNRAFAWRGKGVLIRNQNILKKSKKRG